MSEKKKFFYDMRIRGELEAMNEDQAELIVLNGISLNARLAETEYNIELLVTDLIVEDQDLESEES